MSETSIPNNVANTNEVLENNLKDLLDKMLTYFEKFLITKEDLSSLEKKLNDYENLLELVDIMNNVFTSLAEKVDEKLSVNSEAGNYDELEKTLQKHENEIRNHIRIEQQLKLYADSIQAKLEDSEKARAELTEQTKAMMNNVKKDNQKLTESLKLKNEENEKLSVTVRNLEDLRKDYECKLQGIPQLHERINILEKKSKTRNISPANVSVSVSKDTSTIGYGIENLKKLDVEAEYKMLSSKPEPERKSVKGLGATHYASPMKFIQKTLSNASNTSMAGNKSKEFVRVKLEVADNKHRKDLEGLKKSYQRFYNPNKTLSRERGDSDRDRQSNSMSKTRELKAIYSIPLMNASNSSLLQMANLSHRDFGSSKMHQRSNSHGTRHKPSASFVKATE